MKKFLSPVLLSTAVISPAGFSQEALEEMIVTSSHMEMKLREVGTSVTVIDKQEIQLRGYQSMTDVLRTQVGIAASNSGGPGKLTSLRIRGEEGYRTLVMIDGVDIADPTATQVGPQIENIVSTNEIERVEILRGPQGFIYGADAGGVINIITRSGNRGLFGQVSNEVGEHDTTKMNGSFAYGNETADVFVSLTDLETEGFNARTLDDQGEKDGYENTTLHSKISLNISENIQARLVARDVSATSEYDNCGEDIHDCHSESDQTVAKATISFRNSDMAHSASYSVNQVSRAFFTNGDRGFALNGTSKKVEFISSLLTQPASIVVGGDFEVEEMESTSTPYQERDHIGLFSEVQLNVNDKLYLTSGLRYDDNEDFGTHISLRKTIAYITAIGEDSNIKFRASDGSGFRAPSLSEIAYNNSAAAFGKARETTLKEEQSEGFDVGVEYYHTNGFSAQLTYFDQEVKNEIFFDLADFSGYLQEKGTSDSKGWEFASVLPINEVVSLEGNATFNKTENTEELRRSRRPQFFANLGLRITSLDAKFTALANIRVSRDAVNEISGGGRTALDDYEVVDLSTQYQFLENVQVFGRVENFFSEDYEEVTGFNTSERAIYAGIRYEF